MSIVNGWVSTAHLLLPHGQKHMQIQSDQGLVKPKGKLEIQQKQLKLGPNCLKRKIHHGPVPLIFRCLTLAGFVFRVVNVPVQKMQLQFNP